MDITNERSRRCCFTLALLIQDNESLEDRLKGNEGERIDAVLGEDGNELKRKSEPKETGEQFRARLIRKQMDTRMLVTKDGTDKPNMKENTNMTISMLQQVKENCEDPGEKAQLERAIWMLQVAEVNYSDEMQVIVILEVLSDDVIGICNKSGLFNREGVIPEQSGVDRSGFRKEETDSSDPSGLLRYRDKTDRRLGSDAGKKAHESQIQAHQDNPKELEGIKNKRAEFLVKVFKRIYSIK